MVNVIDPVATGTVTSLARPGRNITGLAILTRELSGKRLELLKEVIPKLSRVAVLGKESLSMSKKWSSQAQSLGLQLDVLRFVDPTRLARFESAKRKSAEALLIPASQFWLSKTNC